MLNEKLNTVNSLEINIINELYSGNSRFSFGNCLYMNRDTNTLLMKNVLEDTWKESEIKIDFTNNTFYNPEFLVGFSFDRTNSDQNKMIFNGYYPVNRTLCKAKIYVDPKSYYIIKQENEFDFFNTVVRQTVFYN